MTLLLKNAHIVDGSGAEPFRGDILTDGDTISAVGNFPHKKTDRVIDCQGAYVAPGFIDVHTTTDHYGALLRYPEQDHYVKQGITSAIGGYDGLALAPFTRHSSKQFQNFHNGRAINVDWTTFPEFLKVLERIKLGVNFGSFVGYSSVPLIMEHALQGGAFGVSMAPETKLKKTAEKELDELLIKYSAILSLSSLPDSPQDLKRFAKLSEQGVKIICHNAVPPFAAAKTYEELFASLSERSAQGFFFAVPPSEFVTAPIGTLLPEWVRKDGHQATLDKLDDSWLRKKIIAELPKVDADNMLVVHAPHHTTLVGLTLREIMGHYAIHGIGEALVKVMRLTDLQASIRAVHFGEDALARILELPTALIGSFEPGEYHTQWYSFEVKGGFLTLLWSAEQKGIATVANFVHKMTEAPAKFFGLRDRGMIREGMRADLIGFKNKTLKFTVVNGHLERGGKPLYRHVSHTG